MRLLLSSALLGLVWFAAINAAATLVAWMLGRVLLRRPGPFGAGLLLAVRLLPAVAASVFVLAVFLPAHWRFEPADSGESFGFVLSGVAAIGSLRGPACGVARDVGWYCRSSLRVARAACRQPGRE